MRERICRIALAAFALLYLAALGLLIIGTYGLFGAERDPLSGVYLVPLGLPWNRFLGGLGDPLRFWAAAAAPLINLALLWALCRFLERKRRS